MPKYKKKLPNKLNPQKHKKKLRNKPKQQKYKKKLPVVFGPITDKNVEQVAPLPARAIAGEPDYA